jgi:CheY-like chemotaxis protein
MESFSDCKVLIVDDEEPFRRIARRVIETLDCRVVEAEDGREALRQVHLHSPDLILLDLQMPGIDGIEVCQEIYKEEAFRDIPVIFVTSRRDYQSRLDGLGAGAVDFITKPFLLAELKARVGTHLRMRLMHKKMLSYREALNDREKDESLRTFAVGLGHNFNNLLTAALGFLSLAEDASIERERIGYLRHIELSLRRMCNLSRQLLAFTENFNAPKRPVMLHRILKNALTLFDPVALKSRVTIICDIAPLRDAAVLCDEFELTQAFLHILNNARESAGEGGRRVFYQAQVEGERVVVEVVDMGPGMTREELAHIREPFYTTKPDVGHGLGLSMVDGIIRNSGGVLDIESTVGIGTKVTVSFPVCEPARLVADVMESEIREGVNILVAVDAEETRQSVEAVLLANGCRVNSVENLVDLMADMDSTVLKYDAIILDLLRNEIFGDELVDKLRGTTDIPIIYLASTMLEAPSAHSSMKVLRKPFEPGDLIEALGSFPQLVKYS